MTTLFEQIEALKNINQFLIDLCYIRIREKRLEMAQRLLRHYPSDVEIRMYWKKEPKPCQKKSVFK